MAHRGHTEQPARSERGVEVRKLLYELAGTARVLVLGLGRERVRVNDGLSVDIVHMHKTRYADVIGYEQHKGNVTGYRFQYLVHSVSF